QPAQRGPLVILALALPVALHALYDFGLLAGEIAHARAWPRALFLLSLAASSLLGVTLFGRALRTTPGGDAGNGRRRGLPGPLGGAMTLAGSGLVAIALLWLTGLLPDTTHEPDPLRDSLELVAASLFPLAAGIDLLRAAARRPQMARAEG